MLVLKKFVIHMAPPRARFMDFMGTPETSTVSGIVDQSIMDLYEP